MGGDESQQRRRIAEVQRQHHWIWPPQDWIKCNTNVSFLDVNLHGTAGWVLRDSVVTVKVTIKDALKQWEGRYKTLWRVNYNPF